MDEPWFWLLPYTSDGFAGWPVHQWMPWGAAEEESTGGFSGADGSGLHGGVILKTQRDLTVHAHGETGL